MHTISFKGSEPGQNVYSDIGRALLAGYDKWCQNSPMPRGTEAVRVSKLFKDRKRSCRERVYGSV